MRGRNGASEAAPTPPIPANAPIAATPAQMTAILRPRSTRPVPWRMLSEVGRGLGLVLLFVGTLVDVIGGTYPADCFTSTCTGSTAAGVQYAILTARILWSLGAFGLSAGAAVQLHFVLTGPDSDTTEENARYLAARRAAFLTFLVGIGILLAILLTDGTAIAPYR
jgi:hypothetical protein